MQPEIMCSILQMCFDSTLGFMTNGIWPVRFLDSQLIGRGEEMGNAAV